MMMDFLLILATEAHAAEEASFGFDFNLLEANIFNLAILVGLLLFYGSKVFGQILSDRRNQIAEAIQETEDRQKKAAEALADEQQKLTQAQAEAERIRKTAEERAIVVTAEMAAQAERDIERLRETAAQDLSSEQERVLTQLRQQIAVMAVERAESRLKEILDDSAQQQLINRSIAQLGG